jgi:hypothetical protein
MAISFFGDEVPEPVLTPALKVPKEPKPVRKWVGNPLGLTQAQMTPEDKRLYARESKKAQIRREAEEANQKEVVKASQRSSVNYADYGSRQLEQYIPNLTYEREMEILLEGDKLARKIFDEVGIDLCTDRIDSDTIHAVAALVHGFSKGYIDANPAGLFVSCRFVDLSATDIIDAVHSPRPGAIPRYDRPWNTSPSFLAAYKATLKQSLDLCDKYPTLVEKPLVMKIRVEWDKICGQGILEFVRGVS